MLSVPLVSECSYRVLYICECVDIVCSERLCKYGVLVLGRGFLLPSIRCGCGLVPMLDCSTPASVVSGHDFVGV
jgi:hypothetical protein